MTKKIGFIVGSLRKGSWNQKVADTILELLPEGYEGEMIEIGNLPFYNEDFDNGNLELPKTYEEFRNKIAQKDALIFVTPEYNRSVPALIKNAVDVASRPYEKQVLNGKKVAVLSASTGATGGIVASYILKNSLQFANMDVLPQPEMFFAEVHNNFDEEGKATERTKKFIGGFIEAFKNFVE